MEMFRLDKAERAVMGERVRAARHLSGLTLRQVADKTGVTTNAVVSWEQGTLPRPELRATVADLYQLPEVKLFAEYFAHLADLRKLVS